MNAETTGSTCPLCKRPMSAAESATTRLCSQCQAIVKNVLPGNEGQLATAPARATLVDNATQNASIFYQAQDIDLMHPDQPAANGGRTTQPDSARADLQPAGTPMEKAKSPIDFTTGPLVEGPPPVTARLKGGALEAVLRESGALREVSAADQPSLADELETLRRTAGLDDSEVEGSERLNLTDDSTVNNSNAEGPRVETDHLAEQQPIESTVRPSPHSLPDPKRVSNLSSAKPVSDPWNTGADEWPVVLSESPPEPSGKGKLLVAVALLLLVGVAGVVSYRLLVKPAKEGSGTQAKADISAQQPSGASRSVTASAATPPAESPANAGQTPSAQQRVAPAEAPKLADANADNAAAKYSLQAASFPNAAAASEFAEKLIRAGVPAYILAAQIPGRGRWFRVRVGRFSTQDEANRFASDARLRAKTAGIGLTLVPCDYEKPDM